MRSPHTATEPRLLQLQKARAATKTQHSQKTKIEKSIYHKSLTLEVKGEHKGGVIGPLAPGELNDQERRQENQQQL